MVTDGCVKNPDKVANLIKVNNSKSIVHAIGIGSGASSYLIN